MFERINNMLDSEIIEKIKNTKVLIVGIGGVGGFALEALIRSGVEDITIVDNDIVEESNLNRQIIALNSTIGEFKTTVAKNRCLDINKDAKITEIKCFVTKDNIDVLFDKNYDYIIDACDTITTKVLLIKKAIEQNIKIISCMGTGNRFDPTKLKVTRLDKTEGDPLAKSLRKLLRDENITLKIPVVWSSELPLKNNTRTPNSCILVPSVAGIYLSSYIINDILSNK